MSKDDFWLGWLAGITGTVLGFLIVLIIAVVLKSFDIF